MRRYDFLGIDKIDLIYELGDSESVAFVYMLIFIVRIKARITRVVFFFPIFYPSYSSVL